MAHVAIHKRETQLTVRLYKRVKFLVGTSYYIDYQGFNTIAF